MKIGELLAEGKTKRVLSLSGEPDAVILEAKDDITAGDGAKHDVIPGKGAWATATACNVFRMLKHFHNPLPVAFIGTVDERSFLARRCTMLPFEVVVRRAPYGGYLKRHPNVEKGKDFYDLKWEFFLKTTGQTFKQYGFGVDDPLLIFNGGQGGVAWIYHPAKPASEYSHLMNIPVEEIVEPELISNIAEGKVDAGMLFALMKEYALQAFILLEEEWKKLGGRLVDFKVEFGIDQGGNLLLADVIDNDSWRLLDSSGNHLDKQLYRDSRPLEEVAAAYKIVADLTRRFV